MRYLQPLQPLGLLVLRAVLGAIMVGHGYPKVWGGMHNYVVLISGLGLPWWMAYFSAGAEFFGGIMLILGLFTPLAAFAIVINMSVAIWKVHWKVGLLGRGGYEFPLALAAIAFLLISFGAGPISLDEVFVRSRRSGKSAGGK